MERFLELTLGRFLASRASPALPSHDLELIKLQVGHYEAIRTDVRDEIKRRIDQRDRITLQLVLALGSLLAAGLTQPRLSFAFLALPLVAVYFTSLLMYSYLIHCSIAQYVKNVLEPTIAKLLSLEVIDEWETYYSKRQVPGIRKSLFIWVMVFAVASSPSIWSVFGSLEAPMPVWAAVWFMVVGLAAVWVIVGFDEFFRQLDNRIFKSCGERPLRFVVYLVFISYCVLLIWFAAR